MKKLLSIVAVSVFALSANAGTLDDVKNRGFLKCGVTTGLAGFAAPDDSGNWTGLDVDMCRAVAAGAIARKVLSKKIKNEYKISGALVQIGKIKINYNNWNDKFIEKNDFFCPDDKIVSEWESLISKARKEGSSLGAIIELRCTGMPVGLGEPIYDKLDADLAKSIMSINAVKGVEIGNGFESVNETGISNVDEMRIKNDKPIFLSNNNGGILGGISTGQDLIVRFCVKPTSSIQSSKKTINTKFQETNISTKGRHDPCVGIRAVPVGEAMMATTLVDHCLRYL